MSPFTTLQKILPQHGLSRLARSAANSTTPWFKNLLIESFTRSYNVDLSEATGQKPEDYPSFNAFFTRALQTGTRPIDADLAVVVSPTDGTISQCGAIESGTLLQAKGNHYNIRDLAGVLGDGFDRGSFATVYLAPNNYHRVHLPIAGRLTHTLTQPGALFSVNNHTVEAIKDLFVRNERLVCRFETILGPVLVILVGAMIVASIETVWGSPTSPYQHVELNEHHLDFEKGAELGRFLLGSTVICCFPQHTITLDPNLAPATPVKMGQSIGVIKI